MTRSDFHGSAPARLLLVDDEQNILRSLQRTLRGGGWEIETATDGHQALEVFERFRPWVVVSDFRMPGLNGVEFLSRVKELDPSTHRILLTGHADQDAVEEAINRAEVYRFISKPWNDAHLVRTVRAAFEEHALAEENARLSALTQEQNAVLKQLNSELEERVAQRTQMLSRAKRDWEVTFDTIDQPLLVVQAGELAVRRSNAAAARWAGPRAQALTPTTRCHEYLFGRPVPCPGCPIGAALGPAAPKPFEIAADERVTVVSLYPMSEEGAVVCSYRDVTEERSMTRRFVESEKMIAIGNLAGGVAHEINNPLGGILAFSQLMKREPGRSETDLESLSLIEESALRCKRIVESLLRFGRRSKLEDRRRFDVSRCVEDAVLLFRAQVKKFPRCTLEVELAPGLPEVFGDPVQLGQVVLNLLQNALQALPDGRGTVSVRTGAADGQCAITVRDTGIGIPAEHLPRVFEPHFTTKPAGEGTGLGLSIAYRIVEDHGGRITVESEPGTGARFTVTIPTAPGGAPP